MKICWGNSMLPVVIYLNPRVLVKVLNNIIIIRRSLWQFIICRITAEFHSCLKEIRLPLFIVIIYGYILWSQQIYTENKRRLKCLKPFSKETWTADDIRMFFTFLSVPSSLELSHLNAELVLIWKQRYEKLFMFIASI